MIFEHVNYPSRAKIQNDGTAPWMKLVIQYFAETYGLCRILFGCFNMFCFEEIIYNGPNKKEFKGISKEDINDLKELLSYAIEQSNFLFDQNYGINIFENKDSEEVIINFGRTTDFEVKYLNDSKKNDINEFFLVLKNDINRKNYPQRNTQSLESVYSLHNQAMGWCYDPFIEKNKIKFHSYIEVDILGNSNGCLSCGDHHNSLILPMKFYFYMGQSQDTKEMHTTHCIVCGTLNLLTKIRKYCSSLCEQKTRKELTTVTQRSNYCKSQECQTIYANAMIKLPYF